MDTERLIVLAAGGTGGHLFPAEALGAVLKERGYQVILATDHRVEELSTEFPVQDVLIFSSASPSSGSLFRKISATFSLGKGILQARRVFKDKKPVAVVGFGGYPSVPAVFAASMLKIPTVIHEQNAVMGRANRLLASRVSLIATGFSQVARIPEKAPGKPLHTGNPVRPMVCEAANIPYPELDQTSVLRILAFGGSQGARVLSDVIPDALASVPEEKRDRLFITQQARSEDIDRVRHHYKALGVQSEVSSFFKDLPKRMAESHVVISRAGASTVAELAAIGRPSILIPLPGALDQDQAANAAILASANAATVIIQKDFTALRLAREISQMLSEPEHLVQQAEAAKSVGILNAADKLADAVITLIESNSD